MPEKYIKASECEKYFYEHLDDVHIAAAMNAVDEMPAADVVPVIHCKDCKYKVEEFGKILSCGVFSSSYGLPFKINPDDYCSLGEREKIEWLLN